MQPSDSQKPYALTQNRHEKILNKILAYYFPVSKQPSKNKTVYYLAGQPGSGKTTVRKFLLSNPEVQKSTLVLNTDELREFHPSYKKLCRNPELYKDAPFLVNYDANKWFQALLQEGVKRNLNLIFDTTLGNKDIKLFKDGMESFVSNGYKAELHVLAVPKVASKLGIYLRYESQMFEKGHGRFVLMDTHDANFKNLSPNVATMIDGNALSNVSVYKKKIGIDLKGNLINNMVDCIYQNTKPLQSEVLKALETGRDLNFNDNEQTYFKSRLLMTERYIKARGGDINTFRSDLSELRNYLNETKQNKSLSL
jgi:predicted ABC-type ATPase